MIDEIQHISTTPVTAGLVNANLEQPLPKRIQLFDQYAAALSSESCTTLSASAELRHLSRTRGYFGAQVP